MTKTCHTAPNWEALFESMLDIGLTSIEGLPQDLIEWIRLEAPGSELLAMDDAQEAFMEGFAESPVAAVELMFHDFTEAVRRALYDLPFARGSEGWAYSPETGDKLSWSESIERLRGRMGGWELAAFIAAAQSDATVEHRFGERPKTRLVHG